MIINLRFFIPAVLFVLTILALYFYEITPKKTKEIAAELEIIKKLIEYLKIGGFYEFIKSKIFKRSKRYY